MECHCLFQCTYRRHFYDGTHQTGWCSWGSEALLSSAYSGQTKQVKVNQLTPSPQGLQMARELTIPLCPWGTSWAMCSIRLAFRRCAAACEAVCSGLVHVPAAAELLGDSGSQI